MRRAVVMAMIGLAAIGGAVAAIAAFDRSASNSFRAKLGIYDAVFVIGRDGAGLSQLTHDRRFHGYAWSPDGRWIAAVTTSVDEHGGEVPGPLEFVRPSATTVQDVRLGGFGSNVVWRSNGSSELLMTTNLGNLVPTRLMDVRSGGIVRQGASIGPIGAASWTTDGGALAIVPCAHTQPQLSIDVLSPAGRLRRHLGRLPGSVGAGICEDPLAAADEDLAWAPDGRSLFVAVSTGLWELSLTGATPRRIESDVVARSAPAVSPDGRQLVIEAAQARPSNSGHLLYVLPAAGARARLLTRHAVSRPAWSPDGGLIAFAGGPGDTIEIIPQHGGAVTKLAQLSGAQVDSLSWSPTGRQLAFTASAKPPED